MQTLNIERCRVPFYNASQNRDLQARVNFNSAVPIVGQANAYTAVVESAAIDLRTAILDPTPNYEINIWCDLKDSTTPAKPPGLEYGNNFFRFPTELRDVDQLLDWFFEVLGKEALPFYLGGIGLDKDEFFTFTINQTDYNATYQPGYFRVYFNDHLSRVLEGLCEKSATLVNGRAFHQLKAQVGTLTQTYDTLHRLNKIESFLLCTTLPVTKMNIADLVNNRIDRDTIVGSIEMNNLSYSLRSKSDWRYTPSQFRHYSLENTGEIRNFEIWVKILYTNSVTRELFLLPGERMNINLAFYPKDHEEI